ncbi:MAG: crossover junction endodeoxyribonuclease RuvC [Oscillospiraceae bacterium]
MLIGTEIMIIMGIDPGYAIVGVGVLEVKAGKFKVLCCEAVTTPAKMPFEKRLLKISNDLGGLMDRFSPQHVAVEELFFNSNTTTAIAVAEARGVILLEAAKRDIEPFEYTPLQVKQAVVGYGNAEKKQVMEMTRQILRLIHTPIY